MTEAVEEYPAHQGDSWQFEDDLDPSQEFARYPALHIEAR